MLIKQTLISIGIWCSVSTVFAEEVAYIEYTVLGSLPHQEQSYTQGLEYIDNERLVESTGLYRHSTLQINDLRSGKTLKHHRLPEHLFGEGVTVFNQLLYQLTWKAEQVLIYDVKTLRLVKTLSYKGEGWGLTHNHQYLIMSDGTADLVFRKPSNFSEVRRITVKKDSHILKNLNELEWIDGLIFANVWKTHSIAIIDERNGKVVGMIDISSLNKDKKKLANGIAWDATKRHLLVTGKNWKNIFVLKLHQFPA